MSDVIYTPRESSSLFRVNGIFTVYNTCFDKDYKYKGEVHNFWELVYVKEGHIGIMAHDKIFGLQQGEIVFHKPGEFHSIWSTQNSCPKVFIISFSLDTKLPALESTIGTLSESSKHLTDLLIEECSLLHTKYNTTTHASQLESIKEPPIGMDHTIKNYLELLIISIIRQKEDVATKYTYEPIRLESYDKVIAYIHANLFTSITIETICTHCNVSSSTLKNIFKKYVGVGAMEYVTKMKVHQAMALLSQGLSSQEISDRLAFSSPYYFSSVFKRVMGMTPSEYKKQTIRIENRQVAL